MGRLWEKLRPLAREQRHKPTAAEDALWQRLRSRQVDGLKFCRQHAIERFIVDFYCSEACLVIEVEGPIHERTQEEDAIRQEYLEALGLRVLQFSNDEVLQHADPVIQAIRDALRSEFRPVSPSPPRGEGAGG
ncbi:MAG: endonuclease domain-containing protein [Anaerolineae bacterium]|nr:endonuclease domain-containing protein [Anaerolineae bacterium]